MNSSSTRVDRLRLLGFSGSNKLMAGELSRLARRAFDKEESTALLPREPEKMGVGGIALPFDPRLCALAVTYHRTSARCLWDLYETEATRLEPLYEAIVRAVAEDDRPWCYDGARFSISAFHTDSVEAGERQVVGTVKNALIDGCIERGLALVLDPEQPDLLIHVRSRQDERSGKALLTVSLDCAGRPLHQRGYRTESGAAPLREDLAAALVMLGRHDARKEFFVDPMAGAGTLLVEAAHAAKARPLWTSGRSPTAAEHPYLKGAFEGLGKPLFADSRPALFGAELDPATTDVLKKTLETAGILHETAVHEGDFRDWDPEWIRSQAREKGFETGLILTNPPYGARLEMPERELFTLYRELGEWCQRFTGCRAGFIIGEPDDWQGLPRAHLFQDAFGGRPRIAKPLRNGPLRALFMLYDL